MIRLIGLLPLLLVVCGCSNLVYSEQPLLQQAPPATVFRPGVWLAPPDRTCRFDFRRPLSEWPECAGHLVVGPEGPDLSNQDISTRLADGDPMLLQVALKEADRDDLLLYGYWAVSPTKRDRDGRVIAFQAWPVQCGPPHRRRYRQGEPRPFVPNTATLHPLPGLEMRDRDCIAREIGPIRNAAAKSRRWAEGLAEMKWLRDGDR